MLVLRTVFSGGFNWQWKMLSLSGSELNESSFLDLMLTENPKRIVISICESFLTWETDARLSNQDCIPLIEALQKGVRTTGILKAIIEFGEADSNPVNLSARSIGESMVNGKTLHVSFMDSVPRLPDTITRILARSVLNSVLDYALDDILFELKDQRLNEDVVKGLASLAHKYESMSNSQICTGCFERDFNKLLARARAENAFEVILEQDGESFLHQKFISNKLIHIIEPTHSMVYKAFWNRLNSACRNGCQMEISNQVFQVTQENQSSFLLTANGEDVLKIIFKGEKASTE